MSCRLETTMPSESARMSSAAEARFRIDAPNSTQRAVKVIALDRPSEDVIKRLAQLPWNNAGFFTASALAGTAGPGATFSVPDWLSDLAGRTKNLMHEIDAADLVVMVARAGENAPAASVIGEACRLAGVVTTVLIIGSASAPDDALARTLAPLRRDAVMVVLASAEDYVADMLTALRA
jgi:hypothetical protein